MPLRSLDPFKATHHPRPSVNPFVGKFAAGAQTGDIPILAGENLRTKRGAWKDGHASLVVEIGCHKGNTLVSLAKDHPDTRFVGIDITYKRVVMTAERLQRAECKNGAVILANGRGLTQMFEPGEVDGCVIFFPDPWPKSKHAKNRLVKGDFGQTLSEILRPGGWLWLKTDSFSYYVDAEKSLADAGFTTLSGAAPGLSGKPYVSTFERHFTALYQPIAEQVFIKPRLC